MICIRSFGHVSAGLAEQPVTRYNFCIQKSLQICRPNERRPVAGLKKVYKSRYFTPGFKFKRLILHKNLLQRIMQIMDERLPIVGAKIKAGEITSFTELFKFIPKTALAKALSINTGRHILKFEDPYFFRLGEMIELARLMNIEPEYLLKIMLPVIDGVTDRKFTEKPKPKSEDAEKARQQAKDLKSKGMKDKEIMEIMDISRMTLHRYLKEK